MEEQSSSATQSGRTYKLSCGVKVFPYTLLVDGAGVGLAAFGMLNPLLAAFIHVSSERAFILNSARLLPRTQWA
jgi:hypothetical protein